MKIGFLNKKQPITGIAKPLNCTQWNPANQNYTHCESTRWLYDPSTSSESQVANWVREPLENPTIYEYNGEANDDFVGTTNKQTNVLRQWHHQIETATLAGTVTSGQTVSVSIYEPYMNYFTETFRM